MISILLQIEQLTELAKKGTEAASKQDPGVALALYVLIAAVIVLCVIVFFMGKFMFSLLKKKDNQIEEKSKELIEMLNLAFRTQESFTKSVIEMHNYLKESNERAKHNYIELNKNINMHHEQSKDELQKHHDFFKDVIGKIENDYLKKK